MATIAHPWDMILGIILGAGFLLAFYRAVQFQWPDSYFAAGDVTSYAISISPFRYLLFRFLPVYAVTVFVAVTLMRVDSGPLLAVVLIAAIHSAPTTYVTFRDLASPAVIRRHRAPVSLLRVVTVVCTFGVALTAYASRNALAPLIPKVSDVATTLWTAAIAGILGAYALQVSRGRQSNSSELARRSADAIPKHLWRLAGTLADDYDIDRNLLRGVMVAENLQRPRWFRWAERVKGLFWKQGTYGIMQVSAHHPISDEESIQIAARDRFVGRSVVQADGQPDYSKVEQFARDWNPDPTFVELLWYGYWEAKQRG